MATRTRTPKVYTYFIQATIGGCVKIGRAKDPKARLKDLQTASPSPLILLGTLPSDRERQLHSRFSDCREHGEWFWLSDDLATFINTEFPSKPELPRAKEVLTTEGWAKQKALAESGGIWICVTELADWIHENQKWFRSDIESCEWRKLPPEDRALRAVDDLCECEACCFRRAMDILDTTDGITGFIWRDEGMMLCVYFQSLPAGGNWDIIDNLLAAFSDTDFIGISLNAIAFTPQGAWKDQQLFARHTGYPVIGTGANCRLAGPFDPVEPEIVDKPMFVEAP